MKTSLQLKMGQQLTMTPQLQQAIRLLQLSTLDLQQEIQQALDSNPMLEVSEDEVTNTSSNDDHSEQASPENTTEKIEKTDSEWEETIPSELSVDSSWDDIYPSLPTNMAASAAEDTNFDSFRSETDNLQDHLQWQLNLTPLSTRDRIIGESIIEACDNDGYIKSSLEDIFSGLQDELEEENDDDDDRLDLSEVNAVLHRLQQFDPPGVCALDLGDCLAIQLKQMPEQVEYIQQALLVVKIFCRNWPVVILRKLCAKLR